MQDVFISHVEEDAGVALELAEELERAAITAWYYEHYERDSVPGLPYLTQVSTAIEQSRVVVLIISPHSLRVGQVVEKG